MVTEDPPIVWRQLLAARIGLFVLCVGLATVTGSASEHPGALAALAVLLVVAGLPRLATQRWVPVIEAVVAAVIIVAVDPLDTALLPYLLAPAFAAGVVGGLSVAITAAGLSALVILLAPALGLQSGDVRDYLASTAPWVALAVAAGAVGAWLGRLQQEVPASDSAYLAANRLLNELHGVVRQLSAGLDATTVAEGLLVETKPAVPYQRAMVFAVADLSTVLPLARSGVERLEWDTDPAGSGPVAQAIRSGLPLSGVTDDEAEAAGYWAVVPLLVGQRVVAVLCLDRAEAPFPMDQLRALQADSTESAVRLDTAVLFAQVQEVATAEERRRLAREIHDGIAQELASLGYAVDDLLANATDAQSIAALRALRDEMTRIVAELRLSLFDLRSDVAEGPGLGSALSDYVRSVGSRSGLRVHIVLDEGRDRLPPPVEAELLRIAQEAVTNARKHSGADTLWVSCSIDPPRALLRVSDNGRGMGVPRADSFGLQVMRERATRIGADLAVGQRPGGGTLVEVTVGGQSLTDGEPRPGEAIPARQTAAPTPADPE